MKAKSTKEWIGKAEHDYISAKTLIRRRTRPVYDNVCFHCQQCLEKYLKAFLITNSRRFPKSHDLMRLLDFSVDLDGSFELIRDIIKPLNDYAVNVRYPGDEPTRQEARHAIKIMEEARRFIQQKLK